MKHWHVICIAIFAVVVDHLILSGKIDTAKQEAISESGDLDRDEVKSSCLLR